MLDTSSAASDANAQAERLLPPASEQGPAMRLLTTRQKAFVVALVDLGHWKNHQKAAEIAGYASRGSPDSAKVRAAENMRNPKVVAAIQEAVRKRLESGTALALGVVEEILLDDSAARKDRLKAAELMFDRGGMHATTEHKLSVTREETRAEKIKAIHEYALALGKDPREFLGSLTDAIDGDFQVLDELDKGAPALPAEVRQ